MKSLVILAFLAVSLGSVISLQCEVPPMFRRECGYVGITREQCETVRGCCYDDTTENARFCYHESDPQCHVKPIYREECGFFGITEEACEQNEGCCYHDNPTDDIDNVVDVKWCFKQRNELCEVAPDNRKECGFVGITRGDCEKRGCCYNSNVSPKYPNAKWCFKKLTKLEAAIEAEEEDEGSALL